MLQKILPFPWIVSDEDYWYLLELLDDLGNNFYEDSRMPQRFKRDETDLGDYKVWNQNGDLSDY